MKKKAYPRGPRLINKTAFLKDPGFELLIRAYESLCISDLEYKQDF